MNQQSFLPEQIGKTYHPHAMRFACLWETNRAVLKLYTITATPKPMDRGALA